jgi:glucose/arabinose dehydrogenase
MARLRNGIVLPLLVSLVTRCAAFGPGGPARPRDISLPDGFSIDYYAQSVPGARSLALSPNGIVYVGTMTHGVVYALLDTNRDGTADEVRTIASGLEQPNGVAFWNGALYVAEASRIIRFDSIDRRLENPPEPVLIFDRFPPAVHHSWKYLAIGPDTMLYVTVGSPFNVGIPDDNRYATIMRVRLDGTGGEVFARGVRNSVGFDWDPVTHLFWFTDNGRDWLGDNLPPDELNVAPQAGLNFGYPYRFGKNVPDPQYGNLSNSKMVFTPPALDLGPHVASLGVKFYTGTMFPESYRHRIFIAEHGSWNRTIPIGYRVTTALVQGESASDYRVFAAGWLQGITAWGRPVDVLVMPDGALLVSDDKAGAVYRIYYRP